jgi:hypothetical protein
MDWLIVRRKSERGAARFGTIENYNEDFKLKLAVPLRASFPADARIQMRKSAPDEIGLVDSLNTLSSALIVNERVCQLFEREGVDNIELLPVKAFNHKGKEVKDRYFAVNILSSVDCVDTKQSKVTWNNIDSTMISGVEKLVIDEKKIPKGLKLCRLKIMEYQTIIHRSLVDQIRAEKLKGFGFVEIDTFVYP